MNTGMYIAIGLALFLFGFSLQYGNTVAPHYPSNTHSAHTAHQASKTSRLADELLPLGEQPFLGIITPKPEEYASHASLTWKAIDAPYTTP